MTDKAPAPTIREVVTKLARIARFAKHSDPVGVNRLIQDAYRMGCTEEQIRDAVAFGRRRTPLYLNMLDLRDVMFDNIQRKE